MGMPAAASMGEYRGYTARHAGEPMIFSPHDMQEYATLASSKRYIKCVKRATLKFHA